MKAAIFNLVPYLDVMDKGLSITPPVAPELFDPEVAARSLREGMELFELADELGFDWVTLAEHHYSPRQMTPNPLVLAGAVSGRVRRCGIAILGSLLPMNNPVRLAEEYALLDVLTNGRVMVGLLRGTAPEYMSYGTNPAESRAMYEEGVELMLRAWTEPQPFGWEGRYYQFRTVSIWPRPIQTPHPPVFLSGNSQASGSLAARHHLKMGLSFNPLAVACQLAEHYRSEARRCGWEPTPDDLLYRGHVYVAETDEQAWEDTQRFRFGTPDAHPTLRPAVARALAQASGEAPDAAGGGSHARYAEHAEFLGSPETVAAQIRQFRDQAGIGIVDLLFQGGRLPMPNVRRSVELFGTRVLPLIRDL